MRRLLRSWLWRIPVDQEVDELLVGVSDGWAIDQGAVDQFEEDVVVADDDDVLDVVVVDQRLQSTEAEEGVEDSLGRGLLARGAPCAAAGVVLAVNQNMRYDQSVRALKERFIPSSTGSGSFSGAPSRKVKASLRSRV